MSARTHVRLTAHAFADRRCSTRPTRSPYPRDRRSPGGSRARPTGATRATWTSRSPTRPRASPRRRSSTRCASFLPSPAAGCERCLGRTLTVCQVVINFARFCRRVASVHVSPMACCNPLAPVARMGRLSRHFASTGIEGGCMEKMRPGAEGCGRSDAWGRASGLPPALQYAGV